MDGDDVTPSSSPAHIQRWQVAMTTLMTKSDPMSAVMTDWVDWHFKLFRQ